MRSTVEHYCQGTWENGIRADCPEVVHNVNLKRIDYRIRQRRKEDRERIPPQRS